MRRTRFCTGKLVKPPTRIIFSVIVFVLWKKNRSPVKFIFLYRKALEFVSYQPEFPIYVEWKFVVLRTTDDLDFWCAELDYAPESLRCLTNGSERWCGRLFPACIIGTAPVLVVGENPMHVHQGFSLLSPRCPVLFKHQGIARRAAVRRARPAWLVGARFEVRGRLSLSHVPGFARAASSRPCKRRAKPHHFGESLLRSSPSDPSGAQH